MPTSTVAIIGGGLAGLAAGAALSAAGLQVTLMERRSYLGGRASSYEHPGTGEVIDNCQHVLLGCCTNLIEFYRRIGVEKLIQWYGELTFLEPGGRQSKLGNSHLPAPFHAAPAFLFAPMLSMRDKLGIARAVSSLMRRSPPDDGLPFSRWLQNHSQTSRALDHFWKVVLVSALNEKLECISTPAAAQVFRESFLKSAAGGRMGVPRAPLTELYSRGADYIRSQGGAVELRAMVERVEPFQEKVLFAGRNWVRVRVNGEDRLFDFAIVAVPFDALSRLLPLAPEMDGLRGQLARFTTSPITGVHLWFDREISELDHAVLLDRTIQWMFHKSRILQNRLSAPSGTVESGRPSYVELVISASRSLVEKTRQEIVDMAVRELFEFFPAAGSAKLTKATVVKEVNATFSPLPGSDQYRPSTQTPWPRVFLAGDWTASGWPATMEGAVRSGYIAAEALSRLEGAKQKFLAPDLPASGFMQFFG